MNAKESIASEEFLDTYEGEVMFVTDELGDYVDAIDKKIIDRELIEVIALKCEEISEIFLSSTYTQHLSPTFLELAHFLEKLDIEGMDSGHEGFVHLARIAEDIKMYINEYFVEREFSDVYIFEDSLLNSIKFMERTFKGEVEEDISEVEFF
jgi:hypothetical protein